MQDAEDRFSDAELAELLGAANQFLYGLRFPAEKKKKIQRLFYRAMHGFTADTMDEMEVEPCPGGLERCRDGACMPIGGC